MHCVQLATTLLDLLAVAFPALASPATVCHEKGATGSISLDAYRSAPLPPARSSLLLCLVVASTSCQFTSHLMRATVCRRSSWTGVTMRTRALQA
ncbi:hypothetical protein V8D89_001382 [Ganoderma adspersum]